jgi:hypothetical protein
MDLAVAALRARITTGNLTADFVVVREGLEPSGSPLRINKLLKNQYQVSPTIPLGPQIWHSIWHWLTHYSNLRLSAARTWCWRSSLMNLEFANPTYLGAINAARADVRVYGIDQAIRLLDKC